MSQTVIEILGSMVLFFLYILIIYLTSFEIRYRIFHRVRNAKRSTAIAVLLILGGVTGILSLYYSLGNNEPSTGGLLQNMTTELFGAITVFALIFRWKKWGIWAVVILGVAAIGLEKHLEQLASQSTYVIWAQNILTNFSSEMLGAFITIILIQKIIEKQTERHELISRLLPIDQDRVKKTVNELRTKKYLFDGTLMRADLKGADLEGADFSADEWAMHSEPYTTPTVMTLMNLQKTNLRSANLYHVLLMGSDLSESDLRGANLRDAQLVYTTLRDAQFDENTILPNGQKWKHDFDLSRFTNPNHPEFIEIDRSYEV